MDRSTLSTTNLRSTFEEVIQSYRTVKLNEGNSLKVMIVIANLPSGSGNDSQQSFIEKKSFQFIIIENNDNLCAIRAVIVAIAYEKSKDKTFFEVEKKKNAQYLAKIMRTGSTLLSKEVKKVADACYISDKPCGVKEFQLLEIYFREYQINVINNDGVLDKIPIYQGKPNKKHIYICYTGSHYNVIKSIKSFYKCSYFCHLCKTKTNNIDAHYCKNNCRFCNRLNCQITSTKVCEFCGETCNSDNCLTYHQRHVCRIINQCSICEGKKKKNHVCLDQKYCKNCNKVVEIDHKCYVLTEDEKKTKFQNNEAKNYKGLIWFDYEAYQVDGKHVANLIIAEKRCQNCLNEVEMCSEFCGVQMFNTNELFCEWLYSDENANYTAIAHNAQGYDGIFLMKYITKTMTSQDSLPAIILRGTKILTMTYRKVKLIDSYSFIPAGLDSFPKTFGLTELKKGFFPHLFNKPENQNYVGWIPDEKYFAPQFFSDKKRKEFDEWYPKQKYIVYNFRKELIEYCKSDVELLKQGTLAFKKIICEITKGIDPFNTCITLASVCHLIFRQLLMKPKTIGIIPVLGFNPEQKTSKQALQWIQFISFKENKLIQHARNGGELKIKNFFVDGFHEPSKTIYEFHGYFFYTCIFLLLYLN